MQLWHRAPDSNRGIRNNKDTNWKTFVETDGNNGRSSQCINMYQLVFLSAPLLQARCGPELQPRKLVHALNAEPALKVKAGMKSSQVCPLYVSERMTANGTLVNQLLHSCPIMLKSMSFSHAMPCHACIGSGWRWSCWSVDSGNGKLVPLRMPTMSVSCNCGCKQLQWGCQTLHSLLPHLSWHQNQGCEVEPIWTCRCCLMGLGPSPGGFPNYQCMPSKQNTFQSFQSFQSFHSLDMFRHLVHSNVSEPFVASQNLASWRISHDKSVFIWGPTVCLQPDLCLQMSSFAELQNCIRRWPGGSLAEFSSFSYLFYSFLVRTVMNSNDVAYSAVVHSSLSSFFVGPSWCWFAWS